MNYFSGFSLEGEETLFNDFIVKSDSTVVGFSYGAQKAFEYVYASSQRIDRLILLSPAFFQNQKSSFTRSQLRYFVAKKSDYVANFLSNVSYPSSVDLMAYLKVGSKEELDKLLSYIWDTDKIQEVLSRGTTIEVFLGAKDKIINTKKANEFFSMTTNYVFENAGHLLKEAT